MGKINVNNLRVISKVEVTNSRISQYHSINLHFLVVEVDPNLSKEDIKNLPPLFAGSVLECESYIKLLKSGLLIL